MISLLCRRLGLILLLTFNFGTVLGMYAPITASSDAIQTTVKARRGEGISVTPNEVYVFEHNDDLPQRNTGNSTEIYAATPSKREVCNPRIIEPNSATVWKRGSTVKITWDTSNLPQTCCSSAGTTYLGHLEDGSTNEHLDTEHPLAKGFGLCSGSVGVQVPDVAPGNEYITVLMGDSGNRSPAFSIQ